MISFPYHIILGSQSPRRAALLKGLDIPFEIRSRKDIKEHYPEDLDPEAIPQYLATLKASYFLPELKENELLITADTVVIVNGSVLGKPTDIDEAREMLQRLSGECHTVVTGVAFTRPSGIRKSFRAKSRVFFAKLDPQEIDYYLNRYKPYDKAGSYGIQEWIGYVAIRRIEGSFYNVMGLPIHLVYKTLKQWKSYESPNKGHSNPIQME